MGLKVTLVVVVLTLTFTSSAPTDMILPSAPALRGNAKKMVNLHRLKREKDHGKSVDLAAEVAALINSPVPKQAQAQEPKGLPSPEKPTRRVAAAAAGTKKTAPRKEIVPTIRKGVGRRGAAVTTVKKLGRKKIEPMAGSNAIGRKDPLPTTRVTRSSRNAAAAVVEDRNEMDGDWLEVGVGEILSPEAKKNLPEPGGLSHDVAAAAAETKDDVASAAESNDKVKLEDDSDDGEMLDAAPDHSINLTPRESPGGAAERKDDIGSSDDTPPTPLRELAAQAAERREYARRESERLEVEKLEKIVTQENAQENEIGPRTSTGKETETVNVGIQTQADAMSIDKDLVSSEAEEKEVARVEAENKFAADKITEAAIQDARARESEAESIRLRTVEEERKEAARLETEKREQERERSKRLRIEAEERELERKENEILRTEEERKEEQRKEAERLAIHRREIEQQLQAAEKQRKEEARLEADRELQRIEAEAMEVKRKEQERIEAEERERARREAEAAEMQRQEAEALQRQEAEALQARKEEEERIEAKRKRQELLDIQRREEEARENERLEGLRREAEMRERERKEAEERERARREQEEALLEKCAILQAVMASSNTDNVKTLFDELTRFVHESSDVGNGTAQQWEGLSDVVDELDAIVERERERERDRRMGRTDLAKGKREAEEGRWEMGRVFLRSARTAFDRAKCEEGLAETEHQLTYTHDIEARETLEKAKSSVERVEKLLRLAQRVIVLGAAGDEVKEQKKRAHPLDGSGDMQRTRHRPS